MKSDQLNKLRVALRKLPSWRLYLIPHVIATLAIKKAKTSLAKERLVIATQLACYEDNLRAQNRMLSYHSNKPRKKSFINWIRDVF